MALPERASFTTTATAAADIDKDLVPLFVQSHRRLLHARSNGYHPELSVHRSHFYPSAGYNVILDSGPTVLNVLHTFVGSCKIDTAKIETVSKELIASINRAISTSSAALRFQLQHSDGITAAFFGDSGGGGGDGVHRTKACASVNRNYFSAIKSVRAYASVVTKLLMFLVNVSSLTPAMVSLDKDEYNSLLDILAPIQGDDV